MLVVATHDGLFHADDAFALAALRLAQFEFTVIRTRDEQQLAAADLRVDVGMRNDPATGDFDHHQPGGAGVRPNGVPYAAFGLIWKHFGPGICDGDPDVFDSVDRKLVQTVDANDNGVSPITPAFDDMQPMTVDAAIAALNPTWDQQHSTAATTAAFTAAVDLAEQILLRQIEQAAARQRAVGTVRAAIIEAHDPRVIILDQPLPWQRTVIDEAPDVQLVIFQRPDSWALQTVPVQHGSFDARMQLPEDWAGLRASELAEVTGVDTAEFSHPGRFFAVARSRDGILELASLALQHAGQPGLDLTVV